MGVAVQKNNQKSMRALLESVLESMADEDVFDGKNEGEKLRLIEECRERMNELFDSMAEEVFPEKDRPASIRAKLFDEISFPCAKKINSNQGNFFCATLKDSSARRALQENAGEIDIQPAKRLTDALHDVDAGIPAIHKVAINPVNGFAPDIGLQFSEGKEMLLRFSLRSTDSNNCSSCSPEVLSRYVEENPLLKDKLESFGLSFTGKYYESSFMRYSNYDDVKAKFMDFSETIQSVLENFKA